MSTASAAGAPGPAEPVPTATTPPDPVPPGSAPSRSLAAADGDRLPVRRVRFHYPDDLDAAWIPNQPEFAFAANGLSLLMPYAEPLFVQAARRGIDRVDPALAARTEDYIRQETGHYREHERFNRLLRAQHPGVARVEGWMDASARWVSRRSDRFNLAFSSGGEIMSFLLARWVDRNAPRIFAGAEPVATTLFMWHLAEEVEHKSSAWQVYEQVDGSKLRYSLAMLVGSTLLFWLVWLAVLVQLHESGRLFNPIAHLRLLRWAISLAFTLLPAMFVSMLPGHGPDSFTDPWVLTTWLRSYDPETQTMPLWESAGRSA